MTEEKKALAIAGQNKATPISVFSTIEGFEAGQRICQALAASNMVPASYFDKDSGAPKYGDMLLALDMAQRTGASPLMVMQNLQVIEGRPGWSAQFITAAINSSGKFSPLRYVRRDLGEKEVASVRWENETDANGRWVKDEKGKFKKRKIETKTKIHDKEVIAWAFDASGERLEAPPVSISMAVMEGWYGRNPKWQSMPELMLTYRAAAFFGRTYCPEMLMGLPSTDEVLDVEYVDVTPPASAAHEPAPEIIEPVNTAKRSRKPKTAAPEAAEVPPTGAGDAAANTMKAAVEAGLVPGLAATVAQRDEADQLKEKAKRDSAIDPGNHIKMAQRIDANMDDAAAQMPNDSADADAANPFDFNFGGE